MFPEWKSTHYPNTLNIFVDFTPDETPVGQRAADILRQRVRNGETRPTCLPVGIPAAGLVSELFKIVQSPRFLVILYEADGTHRQIYTDGRQLVPLIPPCLPRPYSIESTQLSAKQ